MDNGITLNSKQFGAILKRLDAIEEAIASTARVMYLSELLKAGALTQDQHLEMMERLGPELGYELVIRRD